MKRWTDLVLVACAGGVALAQWLGPDSVEGLLSALLFGLVVLTILSQRNAIRLTLDSLNDAHQEQLESERRYRALFDACSDVILVHRFEDDGRPGQLVEVNEAACLALGYSRAQLLAMTAEDVLAPEARKQRPRAREGARRGRHARLRDRARHERRPAHAGRGHRADRRHRRPPALPDGQPQHRRAQGAGGVPARPHGRRRAHRPAQPARLLRQGRRDQAPREARRPAGAAHVLRRRRPEARQRRAGPRGGRQAARGRRRRAARRLPRARRRRAARRRRVRGHGSARPATATSCWTARRSRRGCRRLCAAKRAELGDDYDLSVSFGSMVANHAELEEIDELLARADQAMYDVKRARRRELA